MKEDGRAVERYWCMADLDIEIDGIPSPKQYCHSLATTFGRRLTFSIPCHLSCIGFWTAAFFTPGRESSWGRTGGESSSAWDVAGLRSSSLVDAVGEEEVELEEGRAMGGGGTSQRM